MRECRLLDIQEEFADVMNHGATIVMIQSRKGYDTYIHRYIDNGRYNFICWRYISGIVKRNENGKSIELDDNERLAEVLFHGYGYLWEVPNNDELRHLWFGHKISENEGYMYYFLEDIPELCEALHRLACDYKALAKIKPRTTKGGTG